jgi:hypothetical protein
MAETPLTKPDAAARDTLDVVTICRADAWVDTMLPRFAAMVDANCTGVVRRHLLLLCDPGTQADEPRMLRSLVAAGWYTILCRTFHDPEPARRLLLFDTLRAGLLGDFGLPEALYIDPDTDVVGDLQGIQRIAAHADLLWVANPLPLEPVLRDLERLGADAPQPAAHGEETAPETGTARDTVLMEPGFFYMRRDLAADFAAARQRLPDANGFAPGSTYWNIVTRSLGSRAVRLPDEFNRTFWDIAAAATRARSVHYTGQWKRLQPHVEYDRPGRRLTIHPQPVPPPRPATARPPTSLAVVALYRDNARYLPHAFERFAAWERAGMAVRYFFLENDSADGTAGLLADFMRGRRGHLECRQLAARVPTHAGGDGHDRVMTLARMRNYIVDIAMADAPQAADEWTILVDSDILFPADVLERMFAARARDPRPDTIGMLTCYTQQLFDPSQLPGEGTAVPGISGLVSADHYFDTYAFQDASHRHLHPFCGFARCRRCRDRDAIGLPLIPRDRGIVDVAAAFGGLAAVPTAVVRDPRIRWTTYGSGVDQRRVLSEHVVFCDRLRTITGRRVVVLQDVDCVYRLPTADIR